MILKAVSVDCFQEHDARVVSFSDGNGENGGFLILQKSQHVDDQDKRLGLAGIYLQNLHMADYGNIVKIVVANPQISITFTSETAALFRLDNPLIISIEHDLDWRELIEYLSFIAGAEYIESSE